LRPVCHFAVFLRLFPMSPFSQKNFIILGTFCTGFFFLADGGRGQAQDCINEFYRDKRQKWQITAEAGLTSYFGDISYFDYDGWNKIIRESGPAAGMAVTYYLNEWFGLSGEAFTGKLSGGNNTGNYFNAKLLEYNLHAGIDLLRMIMPGYPKKFGMKVFAGAGHLLFACRQYDINDGSTLVKAAVSGTPEYVYFFGGQIYYRVHTYLGIASSLSIHQLQNDKLDNYAKVGDFDYFSFFNIGLSYNFNLDFKK